MPFDTTLRNCALRKMCISYGLRHCIKYFQHIFTTAELFKLDHWEGPIMAVLNSNTKIKFFKGGPSEILESKLAVETIYLKASCQAKVYT